MILDLHCVRHLREGPLRTLHDKDQLFEAVYHVVERRGVKAVNGECHRGQSSEVELESLVVRLYGERVNFEIPSTFFNQLKSLVDQARVEDGRPRRVVVAQVETIRKAYLKPILIQKF